MKNDNKLSFKVLLGYGSGDIGGNLFFTVVAFILMNYLTDEIGLSPFFAGIAVMIGKAWDGITDPVVGFFSDRTRSRWGRRRPWLLFSAIPLGIAMVNMFRNPGFQSKALLFAWAAVSFVILSTFYTFVNIPYNALAPDITKDYDEKTKLMGFRMLFAVVGTVTGSIVAQFIINITGNPTLGYLFMGIVLGAVLIISSLIPFFTVKELPYNNEKKANIIKLYINTFKNVPFVFILVPWTLNIIGVTIITGIFKYYFKYIFNNEEMFTIAMGILLITSFAFISLITVFSRIIGYIGKKKVYIAGMSLFTLAIISIFLFGHKLPIMFTLIMIGLVGAGYSTNYVMPWSILPDAIEYGYMKTGFKDEGVYYGIWTFLTKVGQAFAVFIMGVVLELFNYKPNVAQTPLSIFGIRLLVGPIAAIFFILANVVLYFYPITKEKYKEIRENIDKLKSEP